MISPWLRKRSPEDVPAPVAGALSDYCQRADAPASAHEVLDALTVLSAEDDFRVQDMVEGEPDFTPLGPFAAVDLLLGTEPPIVAQRQTCGYYQLVRELLHVSSAPSQAEAQAARIAPKKNPPKGGRRASTQEIPTLTVETMDSLSPKKILPKPKGRFSTLKSTKSPMQDLHAPGGKETLEKLLLQHRHRPALLAALKEQYTGRSGAELTPLDLDEAFTAHALLEGVVRQERELVLGAYEEHRGASGRTAWALGVPLPELERWVQKLGMGEVVEALRERFRRDALGASQWTARLDLLGRNKYLSDLGVAQTFEEALRRDLREKLLASKKKGLSDPQEVYRNTATALGVAPELLVRTCERLGLHRELQS
jgi:hypothetical protein